MCIDADLLNSKQCVEECDATDDATPYTVGFKKIKMVVVILYIQNKYL